MVCLKMMENVTAPSKKWTGHSCSLMIMMIMVMIFRNIILMIIGNPIYEPDKK